MGRGQESDFINIYDTERKELPFQFHIAGRGTGKTYSAIAGVCGDMPTGNIQIGRILWMRRTKDEWEKMQDNAKGEALNPFKSVNTDFEHNFGMLPMGKGFGGIYAREELEDGKYSYQGAPIGYTTALSEIAHIRGIDLSDVTDWYYDEFIPEKHVRRMTGECDALLNAYETISRNREFKGLPPLRLHMMANSNDIYNPILEGFGLVNICEKMIARGEEHKELFDRGIGIHIYAPRQSFVNKKKETALYRATKGTQFYNMSLGNEFAYNDFSLIGWKSTKGYQPICSLSDATFYKKKGSREIYVSYAPAQNIPSYNRRLNQDKMSFMRDYGIMLKPYYISNRMTFESYELKTKVLEVLL